MHGVLLQKKVHKRDFFVCFISNLTSSDFMRRKMKNPHVLPATKSKSNNITHFLCQDFIGIIRGQDFIMLVVNSYAAANEMK